MLSKTSLLKVAVLVAVGLVPVLSAARGIGCIEPLAGYADSGRDALVKYLERGKKVAMTAIIEQPTQPGSTQSMQVKLLQDAEGRRRATVLQPLSLQNIVSIMDDEKWINYYPDERKMLIQQAPDKSRLESASARIGLAAKNYDFEIVNKGTEIAGRKSFTVVCTPHSAEMPARRYSIDLSKYVLLRLETRAGADIRLLYDTKAIDFPTNKVNPAYFELNPLGDVRTIKLSAPKPINGSFDVRATIGFDPVVPKWLPFGFVSRTPELTGGEDCKMIAVQISDGLASATVYQFSNDSPKGGNEALLERDIAGIRIRIVSDLPKNVGMRLLETFLKEAAMALGNGPELTVQKSLLKESKPQAPKASKSGSLRDDCSSDSAAESLIMALLSAFMRACEEF